MRAVAACKSAETGFFLFLLLLLLPFLDLFFAVIVIPRVMVAFQQALRRESFSFSLFPCFSSKDERRRDLFCFFTPECFLALGSEAYQRLGESS